MFNTYLGVIGIILVLLLLLLWILRVWLRNRRAAGMPSRNSLSTIVEQGSSNPLIAANLGYLEGQGNAHKNYATGEPCQNPLSKNEATGELSKNSLSTIVEKGFQQGYPQGTAELGCFEGNVNADNVFVLVVHYDFKGGKDLWPRPGDEQDVANLRITFEQNRKCAFRECSPKKEDLLALLQDEQKLKTFFGASEVLEPDIFFLIVLSHVYADEVIYTDFLRSSDPDRYKTFTTNELFASIKNTFPKSLKNVFLGPCRGGLEDRLFNLDQKNANQQNDLTNNQNSTRVSFQPNMRNLIIFYSTVETTKSNRNVNSGTWLVTALCNELNRMKQNEELSTFLTGIQYRIHFDSMAIDDKRQTPKFKFFSCDRKFIFNPLELTIAGDYGPSHGSQCDAIGTPGIPEEEKPRSIHFPWFNPNSKKVLRGKRAVIFHQGKENQYIRKLNADLIANLGFETINVKIDAAGLEYYFSNNKSDKSWTEYGCFAAFFFAEVDEQDDGQVCIRLNENEKVPIGKLIYGLLGPKNGDWIGKPKLFFLIDSKSEDKDSAGSANTFSPDDFLRATNHYGWLAFIFRNRALLQNFLKIFESKEIKGEKSLQESLADLQMENKKNEAMMVSTLPHLLFFQELPRHFVQPKFLIEGFESGQEMKTVEWEFLLESKQIRENQMWLLSSPPGFGKSTVMREMSFELQRNSNGEIKVVFISPLNTLRLFRNAKMERKVPTLASIVSHASGAREEEILNLIDAKRIKLMFDGFDEIFNLHRKEVIDVFAEAVEKKVPIWISTQPHEKNAILAKLESGNQVCKVEIRPFDDEQKMEFLMMLSNKSKEECKRQIEAYRQNCSEDVLGNPHYLKMIAVPGDYKGETNDQFAIIEKNVYRELRSSLGHLDGAHFDAALISCEKEIGNAAVNFLCHGTTDELKNVNSNGIVTISNGRAQFVHRTFAEFLVAKQFVNCLVDEHEMPFDIFSDGLHQVGKFVDMKITSSREEHSDLMKSLEKYLKKIITKSNLTDLIRSDISSFQISTAAANLVTFNEDETSELNFVTSDQILVSACECNENFALRLLENGAYEKLADQKTAVVEILAGAIRHNFVQLFQKLEKEIGRADVMDLVHKNEKIKDAVVQAADKKHHEVLSLVHEKGLLDPSDQGEPSQNPFNTNEAAGEPSQNSLSTIVEQGSSNPLIAANLGYLEGQGNADQNYATGEPCQNPLSKNEATEELSRNSLSTIVEQGFQLGYPQGTAELGHFEGNGNADIVFVLVVHYDFKNGKNDWPRPGDEQDVKNLRKTFEQNRNCAFRECSPKKGDLLALLQDEQKLKTFFGASEVLEPDVFLMIVLSHGNADGVIYTDILCSSDPDDYETFTTNELFKSINYTFPKSLKNVFLGPCRGGLEDRLFNPDQKNANQQNGLTNNQNSSRVSFEPDMRNLIIFYSTVETTMSNRSVCSGTWLVTALCNELNRMKQNEEHLTFLTGIQYRIHFDSMAIDDKRQTPEFKFFSCDRKFIFNHLDLTIAGDYGPSHSGQVDAKGTPGFPEEEKPRSIHFPWFNPNSKKVLRGRRAVIFNQGEENKVTRELDSALTGNLGFETINVKIDAAGLEYYFSINKSDKSWTEYGCFAAFFFAEVKEQDDGQVCIRLNKNEKYPIGQLIHRLLGPKNGDWIGKPKLFFLIDSKSEDKDSAGSSNTFNPDDFLRATNHYGWLAFILRNPALLQNFLKIFESKKIKGEKCLQESLADLQMENKKNEAMMVSTLPQLLFFPELQRHFIKPKFSIEGNGFESGQEVKWEFLLDSNHIRENRIWLLSSLPGSGKSTVMREMSYELQRNVRDKITVVFISLINICSLFRTAEKKNKKTPSLASIVSQASGTREKEIENLIKKKSIYLMFDGFDEICTFYPEVLEVFAEATREKTPIWISTRPHEEDKIREKLGKENQVCKVKIMPLDDEQIIDYWMMLSNKSKDECTSQIELYRQNGSEDILENPLHLKMIAELSDSDNKEKTNLYEIYEKIVDKKLRFSLSSDFVGEKLETKLDSCEKEIRIAAVDFLCGNKTDDLKIKNNGIVTISNGRAQFVHQTFAEFLVAKQFVNCLVDEHEMPFDIFSDGLHQVGKFVDMKITSREENSDLFERLERFLKKILTKSNLKQFLRSDISHFQISSAAANLVTFNEDEKSELNYATSDQILDMACECNENFALSLLENGAYEKLADPNTAVVKMLEGAITNNFVQLFSKIEERCANLMGLVRANGALEEIFEYAANRNHHEVLRLVLEKEILDRGDKNTLKIVLQSAVDGNSTECVALLIEYGAQTAGLNLRTQEENLMINLPFLMFLIGSKRMTDISATNIKTTEALLKTKDEHVFQLASRCFNHSLEEYLAPNAQVGKFLFEKYSENADFKVSSSALLDVAKWRKSHDTAEMLGRWLVEKRGFQIRENDERGRDAIYWAEWSKNAGLVKYFLEKDKETSSQR